MDIWIENRFPGLNEIISLAKRSSYLYARTKKRHQAIVRSCIRRKKKSIPKNTPLWFGFVWVEENKRRDPDNIAAGGRKIIFDALVAEGILQSDGWHWVLGWRDSFDIGPRAGCILTVDTEEN